jgi:hypothetical protein
MSRRRSWGRLRSIALFVVMGCLAVEFGPHLAGAQDVANRVINGFEIAPAGSLEWEILDRLAATNQYNPRDLPRLARMTVLESIAMYQNVRADLPQTMIGTRIEGEMSVLWDAAELFYLSATPADAASLVRARPMLASVEAAYQQVDATLGAMPGLSQQAAFHLHDIARLLPIMNALIDAMEADLGVSSTVPAPAVSDAAALREQSRGIVADLGGLIQALRDTKPAPPGRDALIADLDGLIDRLKEFDRMLAARPSGREIIDSLRLVRSRLWPVEGRFLQLPRTPGLAVGWRQIRQRIDAMSDRFGPPRLIAPRPAAGPAVRVDRRLLAQADRAMTALDAFLAGEGSNAAPPAEGSTFREELGQLRRRLLLFRQQVAAGELPEALSRSLREIEDLNRRLGDRAQSESRIFRGGVRLDPRGLEATTQAVEKLRGLLPKAVDAARPPTP